jgi:hypothetical protein
VAFLTRRYRSEVAMLEIPALVQRLVFPVIVAVGRLLGRYARYANAPAPVRRPRPPWPEGKHQSPGDNQG